MKRHHLMLVGVAVGGFVVGMLLTGASARSVLLPLLLLACPLMMLFMGNGSGHSDADVHSPPPHPLGDEAPARRVAQ